MTINLLFVEYCSNQYFVIDRTARSLIEPHG